MNKPNLKRRRPADRLLFVWDEDERSIPLAAAMAGESDWLVHAICVRPFESSYPYGGGSFTCGEPTIEEVNLQLRYRKAIQEFPDLRCVTFEILYGDQVEEVLRLAKTMHPKAVLMAKPNQSVWSTWLYGDCTQKLTERLECPVVTYDDNTSAADLPLPKVANRKANTQA
ncbi:MAG: universal stress protein [Planctomycetota bacterium]